MKGRQKGNFYQKSKIKYLNMLASGKAKHDSRGVEVKHAFFQNKEAPSAHIESKRSLFNDTKLVTQNELEDYRAAIQTRSPYEVLLSTGNVPYSIINNDVKQKRSRDLSDCFGTATKPKRPRLPFSTLEELRASAGEAEATSCTRQPADSAQSAGRVKGQSRRIWNELYKVLDSSDVVVHVLDARDPIGTRCNQIEEYVRTEAKHKHLVYVLNKVDLVPTAVTAKWLRVLSAAHTAVAFHANSLSNNYGTASLTSLLRQLKTLYNKKNISVGFVGYPNCGKSSIINALRSKKVCKTAPVPGETRVWQYITLTREIYLIDSPGVVPVPDYREAVMKGAIHVEKLADPDSFIPELVEKVGKQTIEKTYGIEYGDLDDLFAQMSRRLGKVVKGGEPNVDLISRLMLHDWHRGRIPFYTEPEEV